MKERRRDALAKERGGKDRKNRRGLKIGRRLFIGYAVIGSLVFGVSLVSLVSLSRLNHTNDSILNVDVPLVEAAGRMIDAVLDQEIYARRSMVLEGEEMMGLFWEKSKEFESELERIWNFPGTGWVPVADLRQMHGIYNDSIVAALDRVGESSMSWRGEEDARIRETQQGLIARIEEISSKARHNQQEKTALTARLGSATFRVIVVLCAAAAILSVASATMLARSIAQPLSKLMAATERISEGKYDEVPDIRSGDEVGDLSQAFSEMAGRLKRLEELYLDASPLTRLPGSIAIENMLGKRLDNGEEIAFCLVDMDNFKAFSDRYGYARGSELIKALARVVENAVEKAGAPDDFVGHIGGDDLVVLTVPARFRAICEEVISGFDAAAPGFYDQEDLRRGSIRSRTRQGQEKDFPIITVSIAVVTSEEQKLGSPMQVGEMAAELKEYAKTIKGSVYVVNSPRREAGYGLAKAIAFPGKSS